jgi:hypothetical protein
VFCILSSFGLRLLWTGFTVSMEGAVSLPAQKVCHTCRVEQPIDQFQSRRGNSRVVADCLGCRDRQAASVSLDVISSIFLELTCSRGLLRLPVFLWQARSPADRSLSLPRPTQYILRHGKTLLTGSLLTCTIRTDVSTPIRRRWRLLVPRFRQSSDGTVLSAAMARSYPRLPP